MFLKFLFIFFLITTSIFATVLKQNYLIEGKDFNASMIDNTIEDDFTIFSFDENKHKRAFSSSRLISIFKKNNIVLQDRTRGLVHIKQKSSVNFNPIKEKIKQHYKQHYPDMKIISIFINSSSFIKALPYEYELVFKSNAYKYSVSSVQLKTPNTKKRLFINYKINAKIKLFKARHNINRGKILTPSDTIYKLYDFERLKGIPLKKSHTSKIRLKKRIPEGKIIYEHNIELLPDILKGNKVLVKLVNGSVSLEFQAISLQDAHKGDHIYVQKSNGKRLLVTVIGKNQVEIE